MLKDLNSNCGGYHGNVVRILHCLCVIFLGAQGGCPGEAPGSSFYIIPCCFQLPSEIWNPYHNREKTKGEEMWLVGAARSISNLITQWQIGP